VDWAITDKGYSQRRACSLVGLDRKTYRYASRRPADEAIRKRLRELASERRRFGTLIAGIGDLLISVLGLYCALESQVSE
jgi:hypothetical protein